jgi:hypothetical protein
MSARKKNAEPPDQGKATPDAPPPPSLINLEAMLMIGEERLHIVPEEDDNTTFMAEQIDTD